MARSRHEESHLQQVCVRWFRAVYRDLDILLFAVPNGGLKRKAEAAIQKGEGATAGVSDLLLLVPNGRYHGLCIEMKREYLAYEGDRLVRHRTYQRPEQKEWQARVEAHDYKYVVVRTFDEFREEIEEYLGYNDDRINIDTLNRITGKSL